MTNTERIEPYLADLGARLPASPATSDLLDELRDHLLEAAHVDGPKAATATDSALRDLGPAVELARAFEPLIEQREAHRLGGRVSLAGGWLCAAALASSVLEPALLRQPIEVGPIASLLTFLSVAIIAISVGGLTLLSRTAGASRWRRSLAPMAAATGIVGAVFVLGAPVLTGVTAIRLADLLGWDGRLAAVLGALGGLIVARIAAAPAFSMAMRNRRRILHLRQLASAG